jgi:protein-S-isoprenylcysteine O-methyltransferase Ste14
MERTTIGWLFVAIQALLLAVLVLLPGGGAWPTPAGVEAVGLLLVVAGVVWMLIAALRLGPALTPTPIPSERGSLTTTGLYDRVRHPIYTGVLAVVAGLVVRSGSLLTLAVGVVTVGFFTVKASWEEARLAERYPDYPVYAARTPRFIPRLRR